MLCSLAPAPGSGSSSEALVFRNDSWIAKLCYLSEIFWKLDDLNMSLLEKNCNIFTFKDKIEAFTVKHTM